MTDLSDKAALGVHALLEHDARPALVVAADEVVVVKHGGAVHGEPAEEREEFCSFRFPDK